MLSFLFDYLLKIPIFFVNFDHYIFSFLCMWTLNRLHLRVSFHYSNEEIDFTVTGWQFCRKSV